MSDDPRVIRSIAVSVEDVIAALEARERDRRDTVLRVTPPFSGRMRARLHVAGTEGTYDDPAPVHIPPSEFVSETLPLPGTDVTHWRQDVRNSIVDRVVIGTPQGPHEVRVIPLGTGQEI